MPQLVECRDGQQSCPLCFPISGFPNLWLLPHYYETLNTKWPTVKLILILMNFNTSPTAVNTYGYLVRSCFNLCHCDS